MTINNNDKNYEWDMNNLSFHNDFNVWDEVDLAKEEGDGTDPSIDFLMAKNASSQSFSLSYGNESEINDFFKPLKARKKYRVKNASKLEETLKKNGFIRLANQSTLIHKSTRDLWALKKDQNGNYIIEQLFEEEEEPLNDTY